MHPRPSDAKIAAVQAVAWRKLGSAGRLRVAAELSDDTRRIAADKIRKSNPEFSEDEVRRALSKTFGDRDETPSQRRIAAVSIALEDALGRLLELLDSTNVPFMLTGSIASTAHGVPRATTDLDVVIDPCEPELEALLGALGDGGWRIDGGEASAHRALVGRSHFVVVDDASSWKVDFVVRKERPFSLAEFERRERVEVLGVPAWVASAEDVVISKLEWSKHASDVTQRSRQRRDVAGVVASRGGELDRAYVERWIDALDLADEWRQAAIVTP